MSTHRNYLLLIKALASVCTLLFFISADAQPPEKGDDASQMDLITVFRNLLSKKNDTTVKTVNRDGKIRWAIVPGIGYTLQNGFLVALSTNGAFFVSDQPSQNQSIIYTSFSVTQKNQFTITSQHNIWGKGNKVVLTGDYRYWIYPQQTYGLGGKSSLANANLLSYRLLRINQFVYRQMRGHWYGGMGYALSYHHRIREEGDPDGGPSDFLRYGGESETVSSGLAAALLFDSRLNQNNPVAGAEFFNLQFLNNFQWLGSNHNWRSLTIDTRKYVGLGQRKKDILAFWTLGWFQFNTRPPYLDLTSTAWDVSNNTGRGYIQGRFRGKNMLYGEAEYRKVITRNGLFGAVLFANAQSVTDWPSNRFRRIHPGAGGGIRIKFNKKSNTNVALDYGFGADGSRGFFVNLGEVF